MTGTGMGAIAVSGKRANILLDFAISIYLLSNVHQHSIKCSQRVHLYRTDEIAPVHEICWHGVGQRRLSLILVKV